MAFDLAIEHLILEPPEFAPGREAVNLSELGLEIAKDGADWGEAQVALQMARKQIGSVVTDRHLEPVEMSIPLMANEEADVSLAEALQRLQQKIALFQADEYEPGWIGRVFSKRGQFAGMVGYLVHSATLHGVQGRLLAHQNIALDITLKVLRSPLCYLDGEWEGQVHELSNGRALVIEESFIPGAGSGLMSVSIKNTGSVDLRAAVVALESRDHPQDESKDTTARLDYECEDLTLLGGSEIKTRTGASGGGSNNVVRASLTASWITVLSSEIDEVGHMTHVGVRRVRMRVYDPAETPGGAELRLQCRPLGTLNWSDAGPVVPTKVAGWSLLDVGEARPERAVLGNQRWEWRVLGRAPGGSATLDMDWVSIEPVEQHAVVRASYVLPPLERLLASDDFNQTSGSLSGKTLSLGGTWSGSGDPDDFTINTGTKTARRTAIGDSSSNTPTTGTRYAFAGSTEYTGVCVEASFRSTAYLGGFDKWLRVGIFRENGGQLDVMATSDIGGDHHTCGGVEIPPLVADQLYYLKWIVDDIGFYRGWFSSAPIRDTDAPLISGYNPSYAGTKGRVGILDQCTQGSGSFTRDFDSFRAYSLTPTEDNRACFTGRRLDFRTDGVHRQHPTDDVWGELVNEGQNLVASPSLLEGRSMRGIIIPSTGDLDVLADDGAHSLEAQVKVRPAFPFSSEALGT